MKSTFFKIFIIGLALSLFNSCGQAKIEQLQNENQSLKQEKNKRDSLMNEIVVTSSEIDSNIEKIRQKEDAIRLELESDKTIASKKDAISNHVKDINNLMSKNQELVVNIESNLSNNSNLVIGVNEMLVGLKDKNKIENTEHKNLKVKLVTISNDFQELFEEFIDVEVERMKLKEGNEALRDGNRSLLKGNKDLQKSNELLIEKLYSGWYCVGTKNELKSKGLLNKKGVLDVKHLNSNFDKKYFKKINSQSFKKLTLGVKKASLLTTHPSKSYKITGEKKFVDELIILDADEFWSVSKFLMIEIEN